jgi:hypothetical protein
MAGVSVGFRALWVNRTNMPDEYLDFPAPQTLRDLGSLAEYA